MVRVKKIGSVKLNDILTIQEIFSMLRISKDMKVER